MFLPTRNSLRTGIFSFKAANSFISPAIFSSETPLLNLKLNPCIKVFLDGLSANAASLIPSAAKALNLIKLLLDFMVIDQTWF